MASATPGVVGPQRITRFRRYVIGFLVALVVIYVALCLFFYFRQDQMIFEPLTEHGKVTPLNIGVSFEDLYIPVNSSEQIHAWWIPSSSPSNRTLLYFHGSGEVIEDEATGPSESMVAILHRLGVNVLMIDYRGFGSSSAGMPNEKRVYDDGQAAFTYLTVQRRVPSEVIILVGHSLGTGLAVEMAKEHPDVGRLVLVGPFTSISDITKLSPDYWYLRAFPVELMLHSKFHNLSKMDSIHVPVLIAVGASDDQTPPIMAQTLFQRANQPKRFYLAPGAGHGDIWGTKGFQDQISAFIQTLH